MVLDLRNFCLLFVTGDKFTAKKKKPLSVLSSGMLITNSLWEKYIWFRRVTRVDHGNQMPEWSIYTRHSEWQEVFQLAREVWLLSVLGQQSKWSSQTLWPLGSNNLMLTWRGHAKWTHYVRGETQHNCISRNLHISQHFKNEAERLHWLGVIHSSL